MELFPVNIPPGREQLDIIKNPAILRGAPSTAKLHVKLDRTRTRAPRATVRVRACIAIPQNLSARLAVGNFPVEGGGRPFCSPSLATHTCGPYPAVGIKAWKRKSRNPARVNCTLSSFTAAKHNTESHLAQKAYECV